MSVNSLSNIHYDFTEIENNFQNREVVLDYSIQWKNYFSYISVQAGINSKNESVTQSFNYLFEHQKSTRLFTKFIEMANQLGHKPESEILAKQLLLVNIKKVFEKIYPKIQNDSAFQLATPNYSALIQEQVDLILNRLNTEILAIRKSQHSTNEDTNVQVFAENKNAEDKPISSPLFLSTPFYASQEGKWKTMLWSYCRYICLYGARNCSESYLHDDTVRNALENYLYVNFKSLFEHPESLKAISLFLAKANEMMKFEEPENKIKRYMFEKIRFLIATNFSNITDTRFDRQKMIEAVSQSISDTELKLAKGKIKVIENKIKELYFQASKDFQEYQNGLSLEKLHSAQKLLEKAKKKRIKLPRDCEQILHASVRETERRVKLAIELIRYAEERLPEEIAAEMERVRDQLYIKIEKLFPKVIIPCSTKSVEDKIPKKILHKRNTTLIIRKTTLHKRNKTSVQDKNAPQAVNNQSPIINNQAQEGNHPIGTFGTIPKNQTFDTF
jgi:glycosyltransferase involved in cell wall biosynthesis